MTVQELYDLLGEKMRTGEFRASDTIHALSGHLVAGIDKLGHSEVYIDVPGLELDDDEFDYDAD